MGKNVFLEFKKIRRKRLKEKGSKGHRKISDTMAKYQIFIVFIIIISCHDTIDVECNLKPHYGGVVSVLKRGKIYDMSTSNVKEIPNENLITRLTSQAVSNYHRHTTPGPYGRYWMKELSFIDDEHVVIHFRDSISHEYYFNRHDCTVDLVDGKETFQIESIDKGDKILMERYAIFYYLPSSTPGLDTFIYIESRGRNQLSEFEVISKFAKENKGLYDTVAIEMMENKAD